jgi:uncharacterized protein YqgC (DUF456 family)
MSSLTLIPFLITAIPKALLGIIGITYALVKRARHPRASLLTALGLFALVASAVGNTMAQFWMTQQAGTDMHSAAAAYGYSVLATSLLQGIGLVLVFLAVFADRRAAAAQRTDTRDRTVRN